MAAAARERGLEAGEGAGETIAISLGPSSLVYTNTEHVPSKPEWTLGYPSIHLLTARTNYRTAPRVSSSRGRPRPSQSNGPQIRADAYHRLLHVACKAALLKYEDSVAVGKSNISLWLSVPLIFTKESIPPAT